MYDLLEQFWKWSQKTPEEYARCGMNQNKGEFEDDFPYFNEMKMKAKCAIDNNELDDRCIKALITIMALDNECEHVLDYIEDHSSDAQVEKIIEVGMVHLQPHARWQIAELICRKRPFKYIEKLTTLSNDIHPYVKKRAQNCIEYLNDSHN